MNWVQGRIMGRMADGKIVVTVMERKVMGPDRPRTFEESGADIEVYHQLATRNQETFEFETFGFMGGATAWILPSERLQLLPANLMPRLETFNREPLNQQMYAALIRNAGAPTIQFCAEPAGGMNEDPAVDWIFDLLDEGTELGIYRDEGWLGFRLPSHLKRYQAELDEKQSDWWKVVRPDLERIDHADIKFLPVGDDMMDGERGIICPCFTTGEFYLLKVGTIDLKGDGWKLCDLECRKVGEEYQPINRTVAGIFPREGKSPMMYRFSRDGGLDECGPHFPLSGEVVEYALSHLSIPLLGPRGLKWLR